MVNEREVYLRPVLKIAFFLNMYSNTGDHLATRAMYQKDVSTLGQNQ